MAHPREGWKSNGGLSRRQFLARAAVGAAAIPSMSAILAACTKPGASTPGTNTSAIGSGGYVVPGVPYPLARQEKPVKWVIPNDNQPIASGQQPETGATLQVYNWADYVFKAVAVTRFEQAFNCKVNITTFDTMDEALSKMLNSQIQADVFFPTIDTLGKLIGQKLLQPVNQSYVPNLAKTVWPLFQNPFYDQEARYTVPYVVYSTGILYRRTLAGLSDSDVRAMSNTWDLLWDPKYKGQVGIYSEYRDALAAAFLRKGVTDLNTEDAAAITTAGDDLVALSQATKARDATNVAYQLFPHGALTVTQSWSGDAVGAAYYYPHYDMADWSQSGYWFPQDRVGNVNNDCIAIPKIAKNPVLAHAFLNFMLDETNSADNYSWLGYQPPLNSLDLTTLTTTEGYYSAKYKYGVPFVFPWMTDAIVTENDLTKTGRLEMELPPNVDKLYHDAWSRFLSGAGA